MPRVLLAAFLLAACSGPKSHPGSRVLLSYELSVDGKTVEKSEQPLDVVVGARQVVPGLDDKLVGLRPGQKLTVTVPPELGYGLADPKAIQKTPLEAFGSLKSQLKVGSEVQGLRGSRPATGRVIALDAKEATLDFNHPLAGKTLVFRIRIEAVQ